MGEKRRRPAGWALGASVLAALAFVVAGCGGSSSSTSGTSPAAATTTTAAAGGARNAAFQAFAACLKQHGVTLPSGGGFFARRPGGTAPGTGTGTTPQQRTRPTRTPAQEKAFQACRSKLPGGGFFGGGGGGGGAGGGRNNSAFTRYTQCLKAHGVTFGQTSKPSVFAKAQAACAKLRPSFGGPGGGTTTSSS